MIFEFIKHLLAVAKIDRGYIIFMIQHIFAEGRAFEDGIKIACQSIGIGIATN